MIDLTLNQVEETLSDTSFAGDPKQSSAMLEGCRIIPLEVIRHFSLRDPAGGSSGGYYKTIASCRGRLGTTNTIRPREFNDDSELISTSSYVVGIPPFINILPKDRLALPGNIPVWKPSNSYQEGSVVIPSNQSSGKRRYYKATNQGTSSSTEPSWRYEEGELFSDGGLTWKVAGEFLVLEIIGLIDQITFGHETLVSAVEVL